MTSVITRAGIGGVGADTPVRIAIPFFSSESETTDPKRVLPTKVKETEIKVPEG